MQPDLPQTEIAIVEITNAFRKENALNALRPNATLTATARAFAQYLAKTDKFAHEADGRHPHERAVAQGYKYCFIAENLSLNMDSRGFSSLALAIQAMDGWKNSPGHRANLLHGHVTETGVAVVRVPYEHPKFVSVQLFGLPEEARVKFKIENKAGVAIQYALGETKHTLPANTIVTHATCEPEPLSFGVKTPHLRHAAPSDGETYVVRAAGAGQIAVDVTRRQGVR